MIKNKKIILGYRITYLLLCGYALYLNTKIWTGTFNTDMFNFYTSLSNIFCFIYVLMDTVFIGKQIKTGAVSKQTTCYPRLKGAVVMAITVTFLIYHFLLSADDLAKGLDHFFAAKNMILHYISPVMIILDWLLFDTKGKYKKIDPLLWLAVPYVYFGYTLLKAPFVDATFIEGTSRYPYKFIALDLIGIDKVLINVVFITIGFIVLGYITYIIDRWLGKRQVK